MSRSRPSRHLMLLAVLLGARAAARADLVSHWPFDGNLEDSVGGNDGSFQGGRLPTFVAGHDGRTNGAIQFDGSDDLVAMPAGRGLPIYSTRGHSIAFWVQGLPQRSRAVYAEAISPAAGGPELVFSIGPDTRGATGRLEVFLLGDRGVPLLNRVLSEGTVFDGEWHCVVWVDAGRRGALYIDGERDPTDFDYRLVDAPAPTFALTAVGGIPVRAPCCFFAGGVDEVQVYNHALSEVEVQRLCPPATPPCPPATVLSVDPGLVSTAGGTLLTVQASGIPANATARVGGLPLLDQQIIPGAAGVISIRGRTPALAAGFHDVTVHCGAGEIAGRLPRAVEAAAPPDITGVTPRDVRSDGSTLIEIRGTGFREQTTFTVGAHTMVPQAVDTTVAIGFAPALVAGEGLGSRDVSAEDSRGRDVLPGGVNYVVVDDPCAARRSITSVTPSLVSTLGGTVVEVRGLGFRNGDTARAGGKPLEGQALVNPGGGAPFIRGTVPALGEGFHTIEILCATGAVVTSLTRGIEAAPPPTLRRVVPDEVSTEGGTRVVVEGANLRPVTLVWLGNNLLRDPVAAPGGASITGYAPALSEGAGGGVRTGALVVDVTAEDSRGRAVLRGGVTYAPPPVLIPGPDQVETSLAEGTARFSWYNPVAYEQIEVRDQNDNLLQVLAGNATFLELPAPGQTELRVKLTGKVSLLASEAVAALATFHQCDRPPPLMWGGEPCNFTPQGPDDPIPFCAQVLSLDGNHAAANITRCVAPPQPMSVEGGGGGEFAPVGVPYIPRGRGGEAAPVIRVGHGGHRGGGGALAQAHKGFVLQNEFLSDPDLRTQLAGNALVTGFILEQPADKLEIAGYYEKLATAFGLDLRVLIECIYPPENAYKDEFTLPDVPIHQGRKLNCITYFRADKDIGHAQDPLDLPTSCQLQIPAGEYRLSFYAVGGDAKLQYYTFATDAHDNEILIQGVPCPPYPLVKITDLTGVRTLPDITSVTAHLPEYNGPQQISYPCTGIRVRFTAHGFWLDENNVSHPVPGVAPSDNNPHFEYQWTVHDRPNPTAIKTFSSPILNYCITDWGCYKVDIEVRDKQCGFVKTRTYEAAIRPNPDQLACAIPMAFLYPTPDPGGMYGVVGLNSGSDPPAGQGNFEGQRPVSFRVLVVPDCYCGCPEPPLECVTCQAPLLGPDDATDTDDDIQFRLAWKSGNTYQKVQGVKLQVKDLCPNVETGAKYFAVDIEDLGEIPPPRTQNGDYAWPPKQPQNVFFQGRKTPTNPNDLTSGWVSVGETDANPSNDNAGKALKLFNRPLSLDSSFWNGHFIVGDQSYHFVTKTADETEKNAPIGESNPIDLGIPNVDVGVPSYNNNFSSGFTSRFQMHNGCWEPEVGAGTTSGEVVSNKMDAAPVESEGSSTDAPCPPSGQGSGGVIPVYEWCRGDEIVNESISQTLFESVLYTGTIWVIPVTIWGRIGLGLDIFVASHVLFRLSPFGDLQEGGHVQAEFSLDSSVQVSIPCEISCDILGGALSIALRLIPCATFVLKTNIGALDASPHVQWFAGAFLDLVMQIEGCVNLLITEFCIQLPEIKILDKEPLITSGSCFDINELTCSDDEVAVNPCTGPECGGGGGFQTVTVGGGAGQLPLQLPYQAISAPVTVFSPDRKSLMEITFDEQGLSTVQVNGSPTEMQSFGASVGDLLNPAAIFVSNTAALVAWTEGYCAESGLTQHCFPDPNNPPPPLDPAVEADRMQINLMQAQQEIVISTLVFKVKEPFVNPRWILEEKFRIADPPAEVPDPGNRRVDGMAAIAADLSQLSDNPPGGEAIVAWVRYEGDFLVLDPMNPTKTIYERLPNGQTQVCQRQGGGTKTCRFMSKTVANFRPQMEVTSIYARRVSLAGVIQGEDKVKISPPGINIEPAVALSPSGQIGYCVWVHDPSQVTDHTDLTESNLGRQLLYSVTSQQTNSWSAPVSVLSLIADYDDKYPGVLEPHMALKDNLNGLLAFTAVKSGGPNKDSGLGGNRLVYGCRLVNGVFGTPFLIHGQCLRRVYGWRPTVVIDVPEAIDPLSELHIPLLEELILFGQTGQVGLIEGSGNVMVAPVMKGVDMAAPAQGLYQDGNIHSNVSGALANGMLCTLNLNSGPAQVGFGAGAGGGVPRQRSFESLFTRLEADLAVTGCRLSEAFPAPGSQVTATVDLENLGLAGTPRDDQDRSAVGLEALFVDADGRERAVASAPVPVLMPGEATGIELRLEMPHEPVRVRVRLNPNPIDGNLLNNSRECLFGAPAPADFLCRPIVIEGEPPRPANKLTWKNTGLYEEILLYRDGSMFASLPGSSKMFIDLHAPAATQEYCVRGRMGASLSVKVATQCQESSPFFRRGFVNNDARDDLSDDVALLGFLFLGNPTELACAKAADNDDNGRLEISDAVRHLNFKFSGGPAPPAPYNACGPDPTPDRLTCEHGPGCP